MRFCRTAKLNKKGIGLTDFFSILAFALILLVFFVFLKIFVGHTTFELKSETGKIEGYESAINILRTPITVDGNTISIAELIALSSFDAAKKGIIDAKIVDIMDKTYGTSNCALMCINDEKLKGSGCGSFQTYLCPTNYVIVPGYDNKLIVVSFEPEIEPISSDVVLT